MWGDIFSALSEALTGVAKLQLTESAVERQRLIKEGAQAKQDAKGLLAELYKQRATPGLDNETIARIDAQIARLSPILSMPDEEAGKTMATLRTPSLRVAQPVPNPEKPDEPPSTPLIFDAARVLPQTAKASPRLWAESQPLESAVASTAQAAASSAAITPNLLISLLSNEATRIGGQILAASGWTEDGKPRTPWAQYIESVFGPTFHEAAKAGHLWLKRQAADTSTAQAQAERASFDLDFARQQAPLVLRGIELDNTLKEKNVQLNEAQVKFLNETLPARIQAVLSESEIKQADATLARETLQSRIERILGENELFKAEADDKRQVLAATITDRILQAAAQRRLTEAQAAGAELSVEQLRAMQPLERSKALADFAERVGPEFWDTEQGRQLMQAGGGDATVLKRISGLALRRRQAEVEQVEAAARDAARRVRIGEALEQKETELLSKQMDADSKKLDDFLKNFELDASARRITEIGNLARSGLIKGSTLTAWLQKFGVFDDKEIADLAQTADFAQWLSREPKRKERWAIAETIMKSPPADPNRMLTVNGKQMTAKDAQLTRLVGTLLEAGLTQAEVDAIKVATRNSWDKYYQDRNAQELERNTELALKQAQVGFYKAQSNFQYANAQYLRDKVRLEARALDLEGRQLEISDKQATAALINALAQSKDADKQDVATSISWFSNMATSFRMEQQNLNAEVTTIYRNAQAEGCLDQLNNIINQQKCSTFSAQLSEVQKKQNELAQRIRDYRVALTQFGKNIGIDFTFDPTLSPSSGSGSAGGSSAGGNRYAAYRTPQMESMPTGNIISAIGSLIARTGGNLTDEQRNTIGAYTSILEERGYSRNAIERILNNVAPGSNVGYTPYVERMATALDSALKQANIGGASTPELWRALSAIESSGGVNASKGVIAGGPLQIVPSQIPGASYTQTQLNNLSPEEYARVTVQYIRGNPIVQSAISSPDTPLWKLYIAWHYPQAYHLGPNGVVYRKGTSAYSNQSALDRGNKGYVTVDDIKAFVDKQLRAFGLSADMKLGDLR